MNKNSKILFLSFTLVLLLTAVGAVSAADTNNTDNSIVSEDNSISESMIQQEKIIKDKPVKDNVVKVDAKLENKKAGSVKTSTNTETKNIKKTIPTNKDVTDYNTLKAAWDEIQADGDENTHYTINVKNGQYDFEDELKSNITNTRYITLNGEDKTKTIFNAQNKSRHFNLDTTTLKLNINNITFIGGNSIQGGSIYSKATLVINNSDFKNNMAFSDSKSTTGGAIDNRGNNSIYNSNFINNQAIGFNGGSGGAIYNYNYSYIHNTTFINNQAIDNGDKSLNVGGVGGAIYYYPSVRTNYDLCTLSLCTFNNNSAKSTLQCYNKANGGAIYHKGVSFLNITSCDFTNNHADYYGGAIIIYSTYGKRSPNVISCFFDNNTATKRSPNIDGSFDQSTNYYNDNSGVTNIPTIAVSNTGVVDKVFNQRVKQLTISCICDNNYYRGGISSLGINHTLSLESSSPLVNTKDLVFTPENNYTVVVNITNLPDKFDYINLSVAGCEAAKIVCDYSKIEDFNNITAKPGKTIQINATFKTSDDKYIPNGKVAFKLNDKTIGHANIEFGGATLNYIVPSNYAPKNYKLTIVYGGSSKFIPVRSDANLKLEKLETKTDVKTEIVNNTLKININPTDENNNTVNRGKVCVKINGKTQKTYSITGKTTYNFTIPTWNNREVKVLVIYGENNNYKSSRIETTTKITLPTNKTAKKEEVVNNYYVSAENGLDTNTGSQTSPFKTIQKAITTVQNNKQTANIYLDGNFKGAGNTNLTVPGDLRINFIGVGNSSIDGEVNYTLKIELDADEYYWGSSPIWRPYMNGKGNWAMNITRGNGLITVSNLTIKNCWNEGGSSISAYKTATIDNYGNLEVNNVSFIFNHGGVGAGIRNNNNATLKVVDSLFEANRKSSSTGNFGAGLYNNGIAIVINSTFQKNYARWGTVTNDKNLTIINSTIKDNIAYDGGSAYRTGSGITVNTGDADYFNPYDVENLVTIVDGCYFENNEELDIYILNGENTVINNVFNKSTGFLSSGNKTTQLNITNNTFDTPIPSSIYTSLSNKDPYLMVIKLEGSYKYIIDSNTVLNIRGTNSKALELTANNATLTNNKFTCEISVIGSDNIIKNNNITTTKNNYAILLGSNSKNNTITENYLQALAYLGNSAVNYTSITNKVENNKPDVQELKIDDETFYKFFDDDGNLLKTYNSIEQIQIIGALNNKNINLPKELIITQTGSFTSYNVTITTNSKLQIIGVTIENTNQQPALVMQNDGVVNQVNFKTNNENTIILKGENNIVENSTLLADMLVGNESVKQENTNNIITKNTPTYKNFVLSQENFNTYFNNDGTIKPLDVEEIHLLINGTIQNKDIIINTNKSVTISNYINSKLLNTTIKTENTPEIIIKGLVIENSNNKTTLDLNSQNILINNNNITTNNTQIKVTNITLITIEENNLTSNTTILDVIDATNTTINENDIKVQSTNNKIPAIKIVGEQQKTSTLMQYNTITTTSPIELENQNAYIRSNTITLTQKDATAIKAKNISTYRLYYAATYSFEYNAIILEKENSNAIIIKDTHDYQIKYNNIILYKNNSTAITLDKTNNVNITSNTISLRDDSNAIVLENVKQSRLYGNDISSTALNNKNEAFVILNNATGVTIEGNSMKTFNNYTILLNSTSKNNRIENNTLCSNQELGDKTVLNLNKIGNAVQYNTPSEITYFYLNEKTYKDYFNEKGQMTNKIKAGSTILLTGNLYNKILNITRPITLIGGGITFYNTTLIVSDDAKNSNITGISFEEKTQIIIDTNNTNIELGSIYNDAINDTPLLVVNGNNNTIKITSTTYITCKNENISNLVLIKITGNQNKLKTAMLRTTPEFNNITAIQLNNANSNNIYVQTLWLKGKHTIPVELINSNKNIFNTNQLDFYGQEENEGIILTNSSQNIISGRISGNENYTSSMLKLQNNSNFNQIKDITIGGSSTTPIYVINSHNNTFYNGEYNYSSLVGYVINITESVGNKVEFNCIYSLNLEGDDCVIQENTNDSINNIINYNRGKQEGFTGRINMTLPSSVKVFDNIKINLTLEHHNGTSWNAPYVLIESGKVQVKINNKEVGLFDVENRTVPEITYQVQPEDGDKLVVEVIYANFDHELCNIYKNVNITVEKLDTKVLLPNTTNTNTKTTFTSMVVDEKGNIVYSGKVAYKLNGKTIGVVKIHNGIASLTVDTTKYALKDYNITAVYGGNDVCSKSTAQSILTLNKYNVNVDVSEVSTKRNSTAVFDVKLCDDEGNLIQTSGKAVLKINGKTVERINITNGVTTIKYQVPANMQNKKYNITVVTSGKTYDRTESNTTLNIVKA